MKMIIDFLKPKANVEYWSGIVMLAIGIWFLTGPSESLSQMMLRTAHVAAEQGQVEAVPIAAGAVVAAFIPAPQMMAAFALIWALTGLLCAYFKSQPRSK